MYVNKYTTTTKFLDVRNYFTLDLGYGGWCKANGCAMEKLVFPYEWLDDHSKLTHIRLVTYEAFYSSLKGGPTIMHDEYDKFVQEFSKQGCLMMMDWLRTCNLADVIPFIEALEKTT